MRERELGLSAAPTEVTSSMSETDEHAAPRAQRKVREGLVVSDKMDKTVVVEVEDRVKHAAVRQGPAPYRAS